MSIVPTACHLDSRDVSSLLTSVKNSPEYGVMEVTGEWKVIPCIQYWDLLKVILICPISDTVREIL